MLCAPLSRLADTCDMYGQDGWPRKTVSLTTTKSLLQTRQTHITRLCIHVLSNCPLTSTAALRCATPVSRASLSDDGICASPMFRQASCCPTVALAKSSRASARSRVSSGITFKIQNQPPIQRQGRGLFAHSKSTKLAAWRGLLFFPDTFVLALVVVGVDGPKDKKMALGHRETRVGQLLYIAELGVSGPARQLCEVGDKPLYTPPLDMHMVQPISTPGPPQLTPTLRETGHRVSFQSKQKIDSRVFIFLTLRSRSHRPNFQFM